MKINLPMKGVLLTVALLLSSLCLPASDLQKLMGDTQRVSNDPNRVTLVWWIPTEFWATVLKDNPAVTAEQRTAFTKILDDYLVFAVISGDVGPMGGFKAKDREMLLAQTEFKTNGKVIAVLKPEEISTDARNFTSMMKPMLANMLGQFGQGIEFLLYPNPPTGAQKLEATKPGAFTYTAFGRQYDWKLPLPSLLPTKVDAKTGQEFPGDYLFNPYTGEKLKVKS